MLLLDPYPFQLTAAQNYYCQLIMFLLRTFLSTLYIVIVSNRKYSNMIAGEFGVSIFVIGILR